MRFPLAIALFAVLLFLALAVFKLGEAAAVRRTPLTGAWSAEFTLDSLHPPSGEESSVRAVTRQVIGAVNLDPDIPTQPFWRTGFRGTHSVDFAPILGINGSQAPQAIGARVAVDSVYLSLSGACCHTGGVWVKGRILGDSIAGAWETDSDGWGAWGRVILRRSRPDSTQGAPDVALRPPSTPR